MTIAESVRPAVHKRYPWEPYVLMIPLMIVCWTLARYIHQPDEAISYHRSLIECLKHSVHTTLSEGVGPFALFEMRLPPQTLVWLAPLIGTLIYVGLSIVLCSIGFKWRRIVHLRIANVWHLIGIVIATIYCMK